MTAGFSLRKIKTPLTLGRKFKKARKRLKLDLLEVELLIKIRTKYLEALEADNYNSLPADTYTKGFIIRYAKLLKLDENKALAEYLKQRSLLISSEIDCLNPNKSFREIKFIFTPRFFAPILISMVAISLFVYLGFQINGFAAAPELLISSPENNSVLVKENIEIKGATSQQAEIYINEQKVQVATDGTFVTDYKLLPGINVIQVMSRNKANKEKSLTYTVEYKSQSARAATGTE